MLEAWSELSPRPADVPDVVEDADTLSATHIARRRPSAAARGAAISDDTGLDVDALGGARRSPLRRFAGDGRVV